MSQHRRGRVSRFFVVVVAMAVLGSSSISIPPAEAMGDTPGDTVASYSSEVTSRLGDLPPEPDLAAIRLVDLVFDDDPRTGDYAVMELLRRSGIPIVNALDMVAAMPDHLVYFDAAFYGELAPAVTRSVVQGDFYGLADFNELLVGGGALDEPITSEQLASALGGWGKLPDDPSELRTAAAAIRALGAKRDGVYWSGTPEVRLDLLQLVLLVSVLGGPADELLPEPQSLRAADATGDCTVFLSAYLSRKAAHSTLAAAAWKAFIAFSGPVGAAIKPFKSIADTAGTVVTALVWLAAIELRLSADPGEVHFGHAPGGANIVLVTATAAWTPPTSPEESACWQSLTNVKVLPQGGLPGFRVRFSIEAARDSSGNNRLLRPLAGQGDAFSPTGGGGIITDATGEARVALETQVELTPPPPGSTDLEVNQLVTVIASLDKDEFPFALKDLLLAGTPPLTAAGKKLVDVLATANNKMALPSRLIEIPVTYHGRDVLKIDAQTPLFMFYVSVDLSAQLYTCQGLKGEWQGLGGLTAADRAIGGDILNWAVTEMNLGVATLPDTVTLQRAPIKANLDLTSHPDQLSLPGTTFGLMVEVDERKQIKRSSGTIGTATLTGSGGEDLTSAMSLLLALGGSSSWPVTRLDPASAEAEALCPGTGRSVFQ